MPVWISNALSLTSSLTITSSNLTVAGNITASHGIMVKSDASSSPTVQENQLNMILRSVSPTDPTTYGQLRITVQPTIGWVDKAGTTYFQTQTVSASIAGGTGGNNLTFQGGTYGSDGNLNRTQFLSTYMQMMSDDLFTNTPVPTASFELINFGNYRPNQITKLGGGQTYDAYQLMTTSSNILHKIDCFGNMSCSVVTASLSGTASYASTASVVVGSIINSSSVQTANYTLVGTDYVVFMSGSSALTCSLPAASSNVGRTYHVKNIGTSQVYITGSNNIDGATNQTIGNQYTNVSFYSNGLQWWII